MNWFIAVPAGWAVGALVVGLLVGNGIRIECGLEPDVPVGLNTVGMKTVGPDVPVGTDTVGTDTVGTKTVGMDTVGTGQVGADQVSADRAGVPVEADSKVPAPAVAVGQTATDQRPVVEVRQALLTGAR
jgi:hypothetical protein